MQQAALKAALKTAELKHKGQLEELMQAAQAAAERERTTAVDKVVEVSKDQSEEKIARAVQIARIEEARRHEVERIREVQEAVERVQRQAETAKKTAIDAAIAATEKQHLALRDRAIKQAEEATAAQWRIALKQVQSCCSCVRALGARARPYIAPRDTHCACVWCALCHGCTRLMSAQLTSTPCARYDPRTIRAACPR